MITVGTLALALLFLAAFIIYTILTIKCIKLYRNDPDKDKISLIFIILLSLIDIGYLGLAFYFTQLL